MAFEPSTSLLVSVPFVLLGAGLLLAGFERSLTSVQMDRSGLEAIGATSPGLTAIQGTTSAVDETLTAPFTGTECLAYRIEIETYGERTRGSNWQSVHVDEAAVPFSLSDESGRVRIDPDAAEFSLRHPTRNTSFGGEEPPDRIAQYLADETVEYPLGSSSSITVDVATSEKLRFGERRLDPGDVASVVGVADYESAAQRNLSFTGTGVRNGIAGRILGKPFVVSNADEPTTRRRLRRRGVELLGLGVACMLTPFLLAMTG